MHRRGTSCRAIILTIGALLYALMVATGAQEQEETSVQIDGVVYGAQADERGPIGGGEGYAPVVTDGDYTVTTVDQLVEALGQASAGETVFIPGDAELDLTSLVYIDALTLQVPGGVTLASDRGHSGSRGALIVNDALKPYQITNIYSRHSMISTGGPDVRVTGLRIQGPNPKTRAQHHRRSFGEGGRGKEYYYTFPTQDGISAAHDHLEVDNCEISGFGHGALDLRDGDDHHIHHCFIHHCQYYGLGYGVTHNGSSSLIECNIFDSNRHSIAGSGEEGCSYVARNNVQLATSLSHCFDMHGQDRGDGTQIAGEYVEIYNNTFLAPNKPVVIRGVCAEYSRVYHNWFVHDSDASEAVRGIGADEVEVGDNAYGEDATVQ